jgi:lipopolysaccharide transport system ATP-binding protein
MSAAVSVSGLSKCYVIEHLARPRHQSLREAVAEGAKGVVRRLAFRGHARPTEARKEQFWALKDVTFRVEEGDRLAVVGRNGAGKSTLLKLLTRITDPTRGRIELRGRVCSLLEVGTGFHPELTGRENIFLNGAILGMSASETRRKFDEIVAFAEVERFLDTPVKRYSSGMYVRLAFSVAVHLEPDILIVDEVLAVGDAAFQRKSLARMEDVTGKGGRTVVLVTHNMLAVQTLCNRAILLDRGHLTQDGSPEAVIASYLRQSANTSHTALGDRIDRQGSGRIRFLSLTLRDPAGHPLYALRCGDPGVLSIAFEHSGGEPLRRLHIAVGIDGQFGERITVLSSEATGEKFETFPEEATAVDVHIARLPLMPGRYGFTLYGSVDGSVADWVQNAGFFEVVPGDFYRSGTLMPQGQGQFIVDCNFKAAAHKSESESKQIVP